MELAQTTRSEFFQIDRSTVYSPNLSFHFIKAFHPDFIIVIQLYPAESSSLSDEFSIAGGGGQMWTV